MHQGSPGEDELRPLAGVRVVDLTHLLAGPFATMMLADNGADVIKVEPPSGDIARSRAPFREGSGPDDPMSAYFLAMNRGKRSVVFDLRTESGRHALSRLIASADVVVENFRPEVLSRLGFDPDEIVARDPRLIVASLSGFGHHGIDPSLRDRPAVAIVAEAASGLTGITRGRDGEPVWIGWALGDLVSGMVLYGAITTALLKRERTGQGGRLDLSMIESVLSLYAPNLAMHALGGREARDSIPPAIPFGVYPAADGHVALGVNSEEFWRRLCVAMDRPELATDPRFRTYVDRISRLQQTDTLVSDWTRRQRKHALIALLEMNGVPCALVAGPDDVLHDRALLERAAFWTVADGLGGELTLPANPMRFVRAPAGPVPRLGQDTREVLAELDMTGPVA